MNIMLKTKVRAFKNGERTASKSNSVDTERTSSYEVAILRRKINRSSAYCFVHRVS